MKKISIRYYLFAAFILITQAAPGALPGPRGRFPTPRGGGCSGRSAPMPVPVKIPHFEPPPIRLPPYEPPAVRIIPSPEMPNQIPRGVPSSEFGPVTRRQFPGIDEPFAPPFRRGLIEPPIGRIEPPVRVAPRQPTPAETRDALRKFATDLKQIETLASKKDWGNLRQHVQWKFPRQQQQRLPPDLRQALEGVQEQSQRLQTLTSLDQQLTADKTPSLSEADRNILSPDARKAVDELNNLKGRLRDLEKTPSANGTEPPQGGKSSSPAPFDGVVPEAPGGAAAAPRQSAREGLPPIKEQVDAAAKKARQRAQEQVHDQIEVASSLLEHHLHLVGEFARRADQLSQETDENRKKQQRDENRKKQRGLDENPDEAVAKALKRPLTPQDRILLQGMKNKGMNTAEIVAQFRDLETEQSK
jgi:chemotaxis protein histidine kinase CheA